MKLSSSRGGGPRSLLLLLPLLLAPYSQAIIVPASAGSFDHIVVGSGPGGATAAYYLSGIPTSTVLLLEAGENLDDADDIRLGERAPTLESRDAVPRYYYSVPTLNNPRSNGDDAYIAGRLFGGSSSVNGNQWVRPSSIALKAWAKAAAAMNASDTDWTETNLRSILNELEKFTGVGENTAYHGYNGPVRVRMSPAAKNASGAGNKFVDAVAQTLGIKTIVDHNDYTTPIGAFQQWSLSQQNNGDRVSSSTAMLTDQVRKRKNLYIQGRSTVLYVLLDNMKRAVGVDFVKDGVCYRAMARRTVVLSAGIRTSLILENSGIGNMTLIQPILKKASRPFYVDLPGVGENLGNEGYVTLTFKRNANDSRSDKLYDIYAGGAFTPYPKAGIDLLDKNNATDCKEVRRRRRSLMPGVAALNGGGAEGGRGRQLHEGVDDGDEEGVDPLCLGLRRRRVLRTDGTQEEEEEEFNEEEAWGRGRQLHVPSDTNTRFAQLIGVETSTLFRILAVYLPAGSKGSAHIQSPDPLTWPLANPNIFGGSHDVEYFCAMVQYQLLPLAKNIMKNDPAMELMTPTLNDLGNSTLGTSCSATLGWVYKNYRHAHHWFGTTKMANRSANGVVDTAGKVYGVTNLRIADNSILPVKVDGNTQVPAYMIGAIIAKKIIAGK